MNTSFLPRLALATALSLASTSAALAADRTPSPAGAEVYIVSPKDGAITTSSSTLTRPPICRCLSPPMSTTCTSAKARPKPR